MYRLGVLVSLLKVRRSWRLSSVTQSSPEITNITASQSLIACRVLHHFWACDISLLHLTHEFPSLYCLPILFLICSTVRSVSGECFDCTSIVKEYSILLAYINFSPTTLILPEGWRPHPLEIVFKFTQHLLILHLIIQGACIGGRSVYPMKTAGGFKSAQFSNSC